MTPIAGPLPDLTLVLGGAASGKSALAEALVAAEGGRKVYVATATAFDEEMRDKIRRHKARRDESWHTIEAGAEVPAVLAGLGGGDVVLIDCATLWLTAVVLADRDPDRATAELEAALGRTAATVVIVSNETGWGIVPENALARRFRNLQGALNRRLAERADLVVAVMAGIPLVLKDRRPGARP